jgi:enterochelin esterase-like enzyme
MRHAVVANRFTLSCIGVWLWCAMTSHTYAEVVNENVRSPILGRGWAYRVYLPPGFSGAAERSYPLLVLLHGSDGDESAWDPAFPVLDDLILAEAIAPLIAVAPASGTSWWVDGEEPFETALFSDLIPEIRSKFPVSQYRNAVVVAGFSMGGYGALRYALVRPELFGGAILLSPALYAEQPPNGSTARSSGAFGTPFDSNLWAARNYTAVFPGYLERKMPVQLFIGAGDDDWNHPGNHGANMEIQAVTLYNTIHKQFGNPAELRIVNGAHDWSLWLPLFEEGMTVMARSLAPIRAEGR